ncbi:MAG: PAS domain S-box protein, partial [Methylococcus sp.]
APLLLLVLGLFHAMVHLLQRAHAERKRHDDRDKDTRLAEIASSLDTVLWEADPATGAVHFLSDSVTQLTGYSPDTYARLSDHVHRIHPEDRARFETAITQAQPDAPVRVEYRITTADGRLLWLADRFRLGLNADGKPLLRGMARDITALKTIEANLAQSRQRYGELVERIPVGVYTLCHMARDDSVRFEYLSDRACEIIGVPRSEALQDANAAFERVLPEELPRLQAANKQAVLTGEPFQFEGRFRVGDEVRWLRVNSQPAFMANGDSEWNGVIVDITESKRVELAFQQLQQELTLILDSLPAQIWYKDDRNRMLRVNAQVAAALGHPKSEIEGRDTRDFYPEQADRYYQDDLAIIKSGLPRLGIIEPMTLPDGEQRWIRTDKMPLLGEDGLTQRILVTSMDVTELHQVTDSLKQEISTRRVREADIQRLSRQFAALSQVNQALLRGQSQQQVFEEICRIQVETGQVAMAWVGVINPETRRVEPVASFGDDTGYLTGIQIYADDRPESRGPTGTSLRE